MAIDHSTIIECFIVDAGFVDQSKTINGVLIDESGAVGTLTSKALSYFNEPAVFSDGRDPGSRTVNWSAETIAKLVIDQQVYNDFTDTVNALPDPMTNGFFKLIDMLIFNYDPNVELGQLETYLTGDTDIAEIYVPESFELSSHIVEDDLYYKSGTVSTVSVPTFVTFSLDLPKGAGRKTYVVTAFVSVDDWLTGYNVSTVSKVVPPLPYDKIYSASLINTVDNIFSTASLTATLSYNTTNALLGSISISGITEYNAIIVDQAGNTVSIPFNVLYKGRAPTLAEIRAAIRDELESSGIGDEEGWEKRIPGVYVSGRFYIIPFWDQTFEKPDQELFPSILDYETMGEKTIKVMNSAGYTDVEEYINIFPVYYNRMTASAVPDMTGLLDINPLISVIPDYQSFSPEEENFAYMDANTKVFAQTLNQILAIDAGAAPQGDMSLITENLLTFYSFVIGKYEICVITKQKYIDIMESTQ